MPLPSPIPQSTIGTELLNVYQPSAGAEAKLLMSDLAERMSSVTGLLPPRVKATRNQTECMFTHFGQHAAFTKEVCARLGIDVDATFVIDGQNFLVNDFSFQSYADFLTREQSIESALALSVPDIKAAYPNATDGFSADDARKIISKLLAGFGLYEAYSSFLEVLEALAAAELKNIARLIQAGEWEIVVTLLGKLLKLVMTQKFMQALIAKIGETAAKKLIGQIIAKALPIVGWIWLIGSMIWAFAEQYVAPK